MSGSSPPVSSRISLAEPLPLLRVWVRSSFQNSVALGAAVDDQLGAHLRQSSAFSGEETTQTGIAPPLSAYCVA